MNTEHNGPGARRNPNEAPRPTFKTNDGRDVSFVHVLPPMARQYKDKEGKDQAQEQESIEAARKIIRHISEGRAAVLEGFGFFGPWLRAYAELRQNKVSGTVLSVPRKDCGTGTWVGFFVNFGNDGIQKLELIAKTTFVPARNKGRGGG